MRPAGTYLPVTAVLGGLLYAKPEGYKEAKRDVIRLSSDLAELQKQQGYALCEPEDTGDTVDSSPLHCSFLVIPAQVRLFAVDRSTSRTRLCYCTLRPSTIRHQALTCNCSGALYPSLPSSSSTSQ